MSQRQSKPRTPREPTIALINVVFLMLVFFLIAGTIAAPLDPRVRLVETDELEGRAPPDAAVVLADGSLLLDGRSITPEALAETGPILRLVPDRELPASELVSLSRSLREAGAEEVWVVTERGLQ
ncbi:ExbD/TolR family protein [Gymnodinialimonas ceratoperidinii]|uniref:Biopolymer transporter ExbD n=1 Tax=Gymnodinialimonas ceratoperidinii TaxID=2856823 RepID=A0A8F6Y9H0_9RHOB|nr:biopolymer transporter ExbD [Gymnodinialimonas ceratoperidinii]QXT38949.1 biopolymer transporter ExbD [Gymnodinialimonas ceratoperidinii]